MNSELKSLFMSVVESAVGSERNCNDGGSEYGPFIVEQYMVDGMSDDLSQWAEEKFGTDEISFEDAEEYLDEVYPEV